MRADGILPLARASIAAHAVSKAQHHTNICRETILFVVTLFKRDPPKGSL